MSNVHKISAVYDVVKHPQMISLGEKGTHGVSVTGEKASMPLLQMSKGSTLKHKVHLIPKSTTVAT